ncbi:sugar O-acetyltransferase [Bifidobacterium tsurumiense]|nr:sugar O-acetyltransferase [Bifidobacterium tsurumiense]MDY4678244.1 sugar O-acetyltransferase [Bifidobacterium tsurumiense]MSS12150.1 sugar O-acetyltransferase [Bifidobacterium tsurumiense]
MKQANSFEKERMLSGELYIAQDPQLQADNMHRRKLMHAINHSEFDAFEERNKLFHELFGELGEGAWIEAPFYCDYGSNIKAGKNLYANMDCMFLDVAPITIGDNVFFGPRVNLYTPYHPIDASVRNEQLEGGLPITIGSDVWFGGSVVVCPGVTIGSDVVVGAGSVVTKDIPSHSVAVGNPCKVVRSIGEEDHAYWRAKADEYRRQAAAFAQSDA